jgi:hypothetical protein
MITDRKALEEALDAQAGTTMMKGGMPGQTDYNTIFKAEKENYDIMNWKFHLDDVEDAFIQKYSE